jgi:N-acetylmuramoyl-L-alanine amidase
VLELPAAGGAGVRTIVLDPGHGGPDAGVTGPGGTREKDYVLDSRPPSGKRPSRAVSVCACC